MAKEYAVVAKQVSKIYKVYGGQKERLMDLFLPKGYGKDFYALKSVSFTVNKGDCVGLIGLNGSGKSTLATILCGITQPSKGDIYINGEPAMIAISSGLNPALTGIENIELKGLMIGLDKKKIEEIKDDIIEFADIGEFIYQPVKTYSSGMKSRLGFAISVNIDPDILVIDEALSVGDMTFTKKCLDKMQEFRDAGKTIFFVSHSTSQIESFCNKALWLEYGMLKAYGDTEEVLPMYKNFVTEFNKMTKEEQKKYKKERLAYQKIVLGEK
ncbi:MAG: teichoic acids export ABC transporter ATP-binding subunit TagH [Roseburia sp.]|nr:teichoic acids export ABC transporter ATP-binding subunit TagH [Roseburia sp.]